jgi:hypothetical protein
MQSSTISPQPAAASLSRRFSPRTISLKAR